MSLRDASSSSDQLFDYIRNSLDTTSKGSNIDKSSSNTPNFSGSLLFNHKFRKRGRNLSVNINGGYSATDGLSDKINTTYNLVPFRSTNILDQNIITDNRSDNFNIRFNYSEPIMKDRYMDLIYSYGRNFTSNDRATYVYDPILNRDILSPLLSNAL